MPYRLTTTSTPTLCFLGVGEASSPTTGETPTDAAAAAGLVHMFPLGLVKDVCVNAARNKTYITFVSQDAADAAMNRWHGSMLPAHLKIAHKVNISYAELYVHKSNPEPENVNTMATGAPLPNAKLPQGLGLLVDFVNEEEEARLLALLDRGAWETGPVFRRTQQYGAAAFNFKARDLHPDAPSAPIPSLCQSLLEYARQQLMSTTGKPWPSGPLADPFPSELRDQLTVNEYLPGDGIANHVDVHSLFEDGVVILSLGSAYVMDLKNHVNGDEERCAVLLPSRSLLTLQGPARYQWSHGLASRKTDKVNGQLIPRGRRVSLSFRRIRQGVCDCDFPETCDSRQDVN